ncbi:hypothetical protein EC5412_2729, partial [Escherichia coli 5412]
AERPVFTATSAFNVLVRFQA